MKKLELSQAVTIFANVGVIVGIVFLAIEIQQNNAALAVQSRLDREEIIREGVRSRVQNPDMVSVVSKNNRGESLTDEEILLLDWENHAVMIDWMLVYNQVRDGILEEETIPVGLWRIAFREMWPRMSESWAANKQRYSPEFVEWMEAEIINR